MDSRKVSFFATIAVIALVAVGIGFAYTAMTTNQDNDVNPEYITITQTGLGEYQFADNSKMYWDSEDFKTVAADDGSGHSYTTSKPYKTKYSLSENVVDLTIATVGYKAVQLGKEFTITATQVGDIKDKITVSVAAEAVLPGAGFELPDNANELIIMQITTEDSLTTYLKLTADNTFKAWDGTSDPTFVLNKKVSGQVYNYAVVKLFCAIPANPGYLLVERAESSDPFVGAPSDTLVTSGKLKFTVSETGVNTPAAPTAMSLTVTSVASLTVGNSVVSKINWTAASGLADDRVGITYNTGGDTYVSAFVEGNVITVTGLAATASPVIITVTSLGNDSLTATITITTVVAA